MITASENQRFVNNGFRPVPSFRILSLSVTPKTQLQQNRPKSMAGNIIRPDTFGTTSPCSQYRAVTENAPSHEMAYASTK
jgi:hypothetical protein